MIVTKRADEHSSYRFAYKWQQYGDHVTLEMRKVEKKVAVQINEEAFAGRLHLSIMSCITDIQKALESSMINKKAVVVLL